jgi:hypothetical protein
MDEKAFERLKIKDKRLDVVPELRIFSKRRRSLANLKRLCALALPVSSGLSGALSVVFCLPDPCGILALFVF